jgi:hypothetical protein
MTYGVETAPETHAEPQNDVIVPSGLGEAGMGCEQCPLTPRGLGTVTDHRSMIVSAVLFAVILWGLWARQRKKENVAGCIPCRSARWLAHVGPVIDYYLWHLVIDYLYL